MKTIYTIVIFLFVSFSLQAQKWDVNAPPGPQKKISFTTNEGTWMDLDVSPDGKTIIFDLLGDIYSMPVTGGRATLLAGGKAWDVQPRFSPDGKQIAYTSDAGGVSNIWIMNTDGGNKHPVTNEKDEFPDNASWTPDGQFLIACKHTGAGRPEGIEQLWLYRQTGGQGVRLTMHDNDMQRTGEPAASPDGKFIYWSEATEPGKFQYNQNPYKGIYTIKRLDRQSGDIETVTGGPGGACRPQISPDGKLLAFVKRSGLKSVLCLRNLSTGEEWPVYDELSHDLQETPGTFGLYPGFGWTPDSQNIIIYAKGKIWNIDVNTLIANPIPFEVNYQQTITEALHFTQKVFHDYFPAKMIRQLTTSPDEQTLAFNAAGHIYIKSLPDGVPQRIDTTTDLEYAPAFSPDGKSLVYIDWSDQLKASVVKMDLISCQITRLTTDRGYYYTPRFSNKGDKVVYRKGTGNETTGLTFGENPGIYIIPAAGGTPKLIIGRGSNPSFSSDDSKIYFQDRENGKQELRMMDTTGANQQTLYTSADASQFCPSPDGQWIAFTDRSGCYITPMLFTGSSQDLSPANTALPLSKLTRNAGIYLHWSKDSKKLMWTLGPRYFTRSVDDATPYSESSGDKTPQTDTSATNIGLQLKTDVPAGEIAFTHARIITMKGNEVIEDGTILVDSNRIAAIGKTGDVQIPDSIKTYDMSGKTIMPGLVDAHAHLHPSPDGIAPQQDWVYFANLAYGVTTAYDPSTDVEMALSQAEMIKAGVMIGPRVYATGKGFNNPGNDVINSLEDATSRMQQLKAAGAFSAQNYDQPRRDQRQQIIEAARLLQMEAVPEGHSTFFNDMSMIADGYTGIAHNIPVWPVYKDVKSFWNDSKSAYTPTLIVCNGTQFGENFWYDRNEVWKNEKLLTFTPSGLIDARSRRRTTSEYGDYGHIEVSRYVKEIATGGTKINVGSNGRLQGLGTHWELWMLAQGGMPPMEVLRCATLNGAAYLGMDKEIGSLEKGKLADLIVLNANPLEDIRNSVKIKYVMKNGRLYDAESMNETGNYSKPRLPFWWQQVRSGLGGQSLDSSGAGIY